MEGAERLESIVSRCKTQQGEVARGEEWRQKAADYTLHPHSFGWLIERDQKVSSSLAAARLLPILCRGYVPSRLSPRNEKGWVIKIRRVSSPGPWIQLETQPRCTRLFHDFTGHLQCPGIALNCLAKSVCCSQAAAPSRA